MPTEVAATVILFGVGAALALLLGGRPERYGGLILLFWIGSDRLYHLIGTTSGHFVQVNPVLAIFDLAVFVSLLTLAIFANRIWPIVAASLQSVVLLGHISALATPNMQRAYWAMTQVPPLLVALTILIGTLNHVARVRRIGRYRDWRRS